MPHQEAFVRDVTTPELALIGGFGSGKTKAFCYKTIVLAGLNAGSEGAVAEPTNHLTRTHLIPNLKLALEEMGVPYTFEATGQIFHMRFREGTTKVYCLSGENYERLVGYNLAFFGSDETDTSPHAVAQAMWEKAVSRVRVGRFRQIFSTSTPEGFKFLHDHFVTKADPAAKRTIHASSYDNPLLSAEYLAAMKRTYTEAQWKVWALGQFGNLNSRLVYHCFDRALSHTDLTLGGLPRSTALHVGMDFNIDHMAAVVHVLDERGLPRAVDELVGLRDVPAMIQALRDRYAGRQVTVYPDASGRNRSPTGFDSCLAQLRQAGLSMRVGSANPPVGDRVNAMNAMFLNAEGQRRYLVNTRTCPTYAASLERQTWVRGEPDKSNNVDHPLDAAGYFIHSAFPLTGRPTLRNT
jgi:hypothetical protein